jgi:hypothetical protein
MSKLLALMFIGLMGSASAQSSVAKKPQMLSQIESGIYSNVRESEETGDRGGVEFRLYAEAKPAYVEAVVCEAECNGEGRYYVRPTANGFAFTWKSSRYPDESSIEFLVSKEKGRYWIEGVNGGWERSKLALKKKPLGMLGVYDWAIP